MNEALLERVKGYRKLIEKAVQSLDDADALKCVTLYEKWSGNGVSYGEGKKVRRNGKLYKTKQAHTSQADWSPDIAASLFDLINETSAGTKADPIPYSAGMALENGKYYSESGIVYLCNRDTVNAVYNTLSELVGIYVEVAS
mgnify:CR=1 FL=1